jgi:hypothetical protein
MKKKDARSAMRVACVQHFRVREDENGIEKRQIASHRHAFREIRGRDTEAI